MASFPYYQLPQFFFSAEFRAEHKLSIEAKVLYAIMQSRVQLSEKNNLVDKNGNVFIYFTIAEVMETLEVAHEKAQKVFKELQSVGLINREISGNGARSIIYVNSPDKKWIEEKPKKGRKSARRGPKIGLLPYIDQVREIDLEIDQLR